jgi:phosphoglycolate phosphatase-like HAD superfamily hydrolase
MENKFMTFSNRLALKAALFDFDGTLVDTKTFYFKMIADFLKTDPDTTISLAGDWIASKLSYSETNIKYTLVRAAYYVSRAMGFNHFTSLRAVWHLVRNHSRAFSKAMPTKDAIKGLEKLKEKEIQMGIISFSSRKKVLEFLNEHLSMDDILPRQNIITKESLGKTKEEAILFFLQQFGLTDEADSCAYIGDLGGDIIAGNNLGTISIGLTTGYAQRETLEAASPTQIFDSVLEFAEYIDLKSITDQSIP